MDMNFIDIVLTRSFMKIQKYYHPFQYSVDINFFTYFLNVRKYQHEARRTIQTSTTGRPLQKLQQTCRRYHHLIRLY